MTNCSENTKKNDEDTDENRELLKRAIEEGLYRRICKIEDEVKDI